VTLNVILEVMDFQPDGILVLTRVILDLNYMAGGLGDVWLGGAGRYGLGEHPNVLKVGIDITAFLNNTKVCSCDRMCMPTVPTCPLLAAPKNGTIDCSLGDDGVANRKEKCSFRCNDGFILLGSSVRKCWGWHGRAVWTGRDTTCVEGTDLCCVHTKKLME